MGAVYFSRCPITGTRCAAGPWRWALANRKDAGLYHQGPVLLHHPRAGLRRAEICAAVPDALSGSVSYRLYPEARYQLGDTKNKAWAQAVSVLLLIAFYVLAAALITVLGTRLVIFCRDIFYALPQVYDTVVAPALNSLQDTLENWVMALKPHADGFCGKRRPIACRPRCPQWSPPSPQAL